MGSEAPPYRLYTSRQAAERVGGDLTESLFDRLAHQGLLHTLIGGKIRWTDEQLAAAVAHHARGGVPDPDPAPTARPARAPRVSRRTPAPKGAGMPDLSPRPGRRYASS